ncbi:arogenate dehydratase/prephenate dehydratase 6, chloroplastic-like protein [Tanacetum coccineum]
MTKKINVHPEWKILQTLTNGAKRKLDHLLLHLVNGLLWKTNDKSGTPHSQSGWKTSWAKKDDKEDQCASRVEDSSNTNQWGKKEAGSSPPSSGKWAAKRKLMMRVGPLVLSLDGKLLGPRRMTKKINVHPEWKILQTLTNVLLDGKLLGPRRMTKKINVHPEWKILQTLTNGAKRKLDHLLLHLVNGLLWKTNDESGTPRSQSGWKTSWAKKDDKEDQCASRVEDSSNTNQCAVDGDLRFILKLDHLFLHLVNGLLWKTNDESGTPRSQSGWKTSWAKKDDKEDQCASRVEDSSNTNQWGKKEAGSSPSSSGKWAAWMLAREPIIPRIDRPFRTSIMFTHNNRTAVLYKVLSVFAFRNINLTKIESSPHRARPLIIVDDSNIGTTKLFEYVFYVDFEASLADIIAQNALADVQEFTSFLRVLGSYPIDMTP